MIFITGPLFSGKRDYIRTALGWTEEELKDDYRLHENSERDGFELPWFPFEKDREEENTKD